MRIRDWSSDVCSSDLFLISPFGASQLGHAIRFAERYSRRLAVSSRKTRYFAEEKGDTLAGWRVAIGSGEVIINPALAQMVQLAPDQDHLPWRTVWRADRKSTRLNSSH